MIDNSTSSNKGRSSLTSRLSWSWQLAVRRSSALVQCVASSAWVEPPLYKASHTRRRGLMLRTRHHSWRKLGTQSVHNHTHTHKYALSHTQTHTHTHTRRKAHTGRQTWQSHRQMHILCTHAHTHTHRNIIPLDDSPSLTALYGYAYDGHKHRWHFSVATEKTE